QTASKKRTSLYDRKKMLMGVAVLAFALVVGGVYAWGFQSGKTEKQKQAMSTQSKNSYGEAGTIQSVRDNKVTVKSSKTGKITELEVNDKTDITLESKKVEIGDVKRNLRVIATGKKDANGKITATRLRLNK